MSYLRWNKEVSVILIGDVVMKSHEFTISPSKILAHFVEGDIIGFNNDNGHSLKADNWWVVRWITIVASFKYEDFEEIWRLLASKVSNLDIIKIRTWTLLKECSKSTLYKLYYVIERRLYKSGSLIIPQSK